MSHVVVESSRLAERVQALAPRRPRPDRPSPDTGWGRLEPIGGLRWVDLLGDDAPDGVRVLHALLDAGLLEAWQDQRGHVRLRTPPPSRGIQESAERFP